jgi:hypothetical protein
MTFLATEALYQEVRDLERQNLIVPVVGDFAGPRALRGVGDYLRGAHATVSAYYVSNVEEYLLPTNANATSLRGAEFYHNLQSVPVDASSLFIRSARPTMTPGMEAARLAPGQQYSSTRFDSAGHRWTRVVQGGGLMTLITTTADAGAASGAPLVRADTIPYAGQGPLTFSGLASIPATISAYTLAPARSPSGEPMGIQYRDVLALTLFYRR